MAAAPPISIVVPCYNEGDRIATTLSTLDGWFGDRAEILVVDDGSVDGTAERARTIATRAVVRVHRLERNGGKGRAIRAAIPLAAGDAVVVTDADLAFDRESLERAVAALDQADLAIGNRRHPRSRYSVPVRLFGFLYRRHLVGMAFNQFVRLLVPVGVRDTQCGLKAFRREALARIACSLTVDGFAMDVELVLVARALGLRRSEVPVRVTYESAASSVNLLRSGLAMARDIMWIAARYAAGRYSPARVRAACATLQPTPAHQEPPARTR